MAERRPENPPQPQVRLAPDALVGNYRVERELGRGAAGVVFAARHVRTGRLVALKILPRTQGRSEERFQREVQALAKLQHPNIVSIHEAGEAAGFRWYSMDLVEGEPLDRFLKKHCGTLEALKLLVQVARGMEHAHARGLVHRDLKPSNVLVTADGIARVSDFGIAKHLDRATKVTEAGTMLGTLHYMSPEQCADSTQLDGRTDVWALGVMLYEAATGTLPWSADSAIEVVRRICEVEAPRPRTLQPTLSPDLEAVIVRALEKEPDRRYPTMAAVADDLERYLKGEPVSASRVTFTRQLVRRFGVRGAIFMAAGSAVAVAAGVFLSVSALRSRAEAKDDELRAAIRMRTDEIEQRSSTALERGKAALVVAPADAHSIAGAALADRESAALRLGAEASPVASEEAALARARLAASPVRTALVVLAARAILLEGDARGARELLEPEQAADADLLLALGEARLADDDSRGAEEMLARAGHLAPDRWEPLVRLAEAHARSGTREGVEELLAAAKAKKAPASAVETARAELLMAAGRPKEALEAVSAALKGDPSYAPLRVERARALLRAGDEAGALADLKAAGQRDGLIVREEVRVHLSSGATADAVRALERLVRLAPDDVGAAIDLAETRAALGELQAAADGLRLAMARCETSAGLKRELARLVAALVPVEAALDRNVGPLLIRLDSLAPAEAALLRARFASDPSRLEAAAGRARGALRGALLAELAFSETPSKPAAARAHAERALEADPGSRRALLVRAALGGPDALAARKAALGSLSLHAEREPALLAFAEGRADAKVALDALSLNRRRQAEEARRSIAKLEGGGVTPPSRELLERAARSLRYAVAADPALSPALVLLGRVEEELAQKQNARAVAAAALEVDPLSPDAAALLARLARADELDATVDRTARALEADPGPASAPLRDALARLHERAGQFARAGALEREVALFSGDRELLAHAVELLERAGSSKAASVKDQLASLDAEVDRARDLASQGDSLASKNRERALALLAQAFSSCGDDLETIDRCAQGLRKLFRVFSDRASGITSYEPASDPVVHTAVAALLDGRMVADYVRHVRTLRPVYGRDLVSDWRRQLETMQGREAVSMRLALVMVAATWDLYVPDTATPFLEVEQRMPLEDAHAHLAFLAVRAAECPSFYAARAIHFARSGQLASMRRDLDRIRLHHQETVFDLWAASSIELAAGELDVAAELAVAGMRMAASDEAIKRTFVDDLPFAAVKDRPQWAKVVAELKK